MGREMLWGPSVAAIVREYIGVLLMSKLPIVDREPVLRSIAKSEGAGLREKVWAELFGKEAVSVRKVDAGCVFAGRVSVGGGGWRKQGHSL